MSSHTNLFQVYGPGYPIRRKVNIINQSLHLVRDEEICLTERFYVKYQDRFLTREGNIDDVKTDKRNLN